MVPVVAESVAVVAESVAVEAESVVDEGGNAEISVAGGVVSEGSGENLPAVGGKDGGSGLRVPVGVVVSGAGRVKYPRTYEEYGVIFGRQAVAVRAWVRHGKKVGSLPPLDDAGELVSWWKSWMTQKVPPALESAAREARRIADGAVSRAENGGPGAPGLSGGASFDGVGGDAGPVDGAAGAGNGVVPGGGQGGDLVLDGGTAEEKGQAEEKRESVILELVEGASASDSLKRLRSATALCFAQYQKALEAGDRAEAESWRKDWLAAEEKQRHWEKDINAILQKRGELVPKAELLPALASLASALRRNYLNSMKAYGREVAPDLGDDELERRAGPHVEVCFERLRESEFAAALRGDEAA